MKSMSLKNIQSVVPSKKEIQELKAARESGICSDEEVQEIQRLLNF